MRAGLALQPVGLALGGLALAANLRVSRAETDDLTHVVGGQRRGDGRDEAEDHPDQRARCRTAASTDWSRSIRLPSRRAQHADQRRQHIEQFRRRADAITQRRPRRADPRSPPPTRNRSSRSAADAVRAAGERRGAGHQHPREARALQPVFVVHRRLVDRDPPACPSVSSARWRKKMQRSSRTTASVM